MVLVFSFSIELDKCPVCEGAWLKSSQIDKISSYSTNDVKVTDYYFYKSDSSEVGKASIDDMFDFE
jgi:Zn-finger nucleic acid-binding protein